MAVQAPCHIPPQHIQVLSFMFSPRESAESPASAAPLDKEDSGKKRQEIMICPSTGGGTSAQTTAQHSHVFHERH